MNTTDAGLTHRAIDLGQLLLERQMTVCTAESCTGGWIAKTFTDIAGSSAWFGFGLVTYSNQAKQQLLHVAPETLAAHGAVSREVVEAMAVGALELAHADLAISVSGVAGPDGGTAQKPVGTVWFGVASRGLHSDLQSGVDGRGHDEVQDEVQGEGKGEVQGEVFGRAHDGIQGGVHDGAQGGAQSGVQSRVQVPGSAEVRSECRRFVGDREAVRRATVAHAIDMLLNTLKIPT